ncbi:MAG TPA: PTS system mannose/fructose/sorbose family transporter subunit IID [Pseudoflavonifractor sp.]|jgi:mannose/fructose/N-acetylgalactosamine-specific phosphotransferase system component IID|nr:PTS system mannose/fructose/sorbose family transporter subunit IID [Pseudoflavonifractor sp.]
MTNETVKKNGLSREDDKMLKSVYRRTLTLSATYNYERMQGLGYVYAMIPVINRFYKTKEERAAGYKRHFEIFNTTPSVAGFITGLSASMEKEAAQDASFDKSSINAVKVSLMGPFAGIGDTIFWAALRIITLGIGISLCMAGNFLGVIVHLLLFNVLAHITRYYGVYWGYGMGSSFIAKAVQNGTLGFITKAAGVVGLMTVGAMCCSMVSFNIAWAPTIQGSQIVVQDILNSIFPNLLPLGLTFGCFTLLNKGVKPIWIMLGMMAVGVLGKVAGIF